MAADHSNKPLSERAEQLAARAGSAVAAADCICRSLDSNADTGDALRTAAALRLLHAALEHLADDISEFCVELRRADPEVA